MKKKLFSVFIALVLVLSFSLVTAVPASAAVYGITDYTDAVLDAADNLVAKQSDDGGFDWYDDLTTDDPSALNCLGITAMGILKGYELEAIPEYRTALAKAYKFAVDNPHDTWTGAWNDYAVDRFPDITFLLGLAEAAAHDTSLLGAIKTEVSGTTAASIAALAKDRWDDKVTNWGPTATQMAEFVRDARLSLCPWDLEAAIKAALALDAYYPGEGYGTQAISIATVLYNSVDDPDGLYFDSGDTSQMSYVLGLSGAIEAFQEVGLYTDKVRELKGILIGLQREEGYWMWYSEGVPVGMAVQDTAYAVMALLRQGESDAVAAAQKGADWLVTSQIAALLDGGWFAEGGAGDENLEVDSEAAWAIKAMLDRFSGSVGMIAAYTPWIGISVDPTWVDFGDVVPGDPSAPQFVNIHNYGNVDVELSASIINESPPGVYIAVSYEPSYGLTIGPPEFPEAKVVDEWWDYLGPDEGDGYSLVLLVPDDTGPGTYTATLVFWAEMMAP